MNVLVGIQKVEVGSEVNSVNARELHKTLEVGRDYSNWIKARIRKYVFIENKDYIVVHSKKEGNNATIKEYYITLDMAKELSMVENNPKGREARSYFIEVEKSYHAQVKPFLIDGKDPHAIIRGLKSQLNQHIKKIELQDKAIDELIAENTTLALPAPAVDVEPYKERIAFVQSELNEERGLKEHFSTMALNMANKVNALKNVPKLIKKEMGDFLDYPEVYAMLGALAAGLENDIKGRV